MWILFALTSATILASRKIQEKHLVGTVGTALGWMIRGGSALGVIGVWSIFSRDTTGMTHPVVLSILSAMLILYPLQTHIYYKAMKALPLSTFGMLSGITPLSAMIFSYLFIGGHLRVFGIIGIFLTVGAIGVLSYKNQSKEIPLSTLLTAVSAYSVFGLVNVLDKIALAHSIPMTYTMMNQSVAAIAIFLYTYFILGDAKFGFLRANLPQITLMGLAISVSWLSLSYALTLSPNAGYVSALTNMHVVMTTAYGVFFLSEKLDTRKIIVFIMMILAIVSFAFT